MRAVRRTIDEIKAVSVAKFLHSRFCHKRQVDKLNLALRRAVKELRRTVLDSFGTASSLLRVLPREGTTSA